MRTNPARGMCDRGIRETFLRSRTLEQILETYRRNGFFQIETPIVEDAENIRHSEGGENLGLVFEIMKRGAKLEEAKREGKPLCDMALRYDLTLPLARFYSSHASELPHPFKVIQAGRVYRAERPQKGRLREFVQCDIDILGDESSDCEIELFATALQTLKTLGLENLTLVLNDKRILQKALFSFGFCDQDVQSVCISLDKVGKIGLDAVEKDLIEKAVSFNCADPVASVESLMRWLRSDESHDLSSPLASGVSESLKRIIRCLEKVMPSGCKVVFSPCLVRGQSYYTGTVGEVVSDELSLSVAGGGRYDSMIGKFMGENVAAAGMSIGFERIMEVLLEREQASALSSAKRLALLYRSDDDFSDVLKLKERLCREGYSVHLFRDVKRRKNLFSSLEGLGFALFCDFGDGRLVAFKGV